MPELSPAGSRLARRVVQDRGAIALSRAGGAGLPLVSATSRVSRRNDQSGTAWRAAREAARGPGCRVGGVPGPLRRRNTARLYVRGRRRGPVRRLLDRAGGPASRRELTSEPRGTLR